MSSSPEVEANERAWLTADTVVFTRYGGDDHVLLIERRYAPFKGYLALPGGHVDPGETLEAAAIRELEEETGVTPAVMHQIGAYSAPDRDPRGRYITAAYRTMLDFPIAPRADDDAASALWLPVPVALADPYRLAFDHDRILADAFRQMLAEFPELPSHD